MSRPEDALRALAALLVGEGSVISPHVRTSDAEPAHGLLAAAGPRAAAAPGEYALLVEAVREGYLLHYRSSRLLPGADPDLALLAGDYLYALGLERLASLGDLDAVHELAELISLVAQLHAEEAAAGAAETLWLAAVVAIGAGGSQAHERAKGALRSGDPGAPAELVKVALATGSQSGLDGRIRRMADSIDLTAPNPA